MKKNVIKYIGPLLGVGLIAVLAPNAVPATTATLTASVVDQVCQGGDGVNVTLTATLSPPKTGVRYQWDFENDGVFDTQPNPNPTVSHFYPDEVQRTARVRVMKGSRSAEDTVTFQTLRCP
jgi:hypothetical protein